MVVFTCGHCGESVQKPKVEKHYLTKCRNRNPNLSCMDCFKDFLGNDYEAHTKCVTEEQRYSGKGFVAKEKKGEKKQNAWVDLLQSVLDDNKNIPSNVLRILEAIRKHNNTPRKKPKFINFVKNVCGAKTNPKDIDQAWDMVSVKLSALSNININNAQNITKDSEINEDSVEQNGVNHDEEEKDYDSKEEKENGEGLQNSEQLQNGDAKKKGIDTEIQNGDIKKLSKKQKKEEKKRQKYEAELEKAAELPEEEAAEEQTINKKDKKKKNKSQNVSNGNKHESEGENKNKKRKRQDTTNSVVSVENDVEKTEKVTTSAPVKEKKKPKIEDEDIEESVCLHDLNVAKGEEADEYVPKSDKFDWHTVILSVLEKKGNEMPFKRLQKKVLSEYTEATGREVDDRIADKFIKKLRSASKVIVDKNRVYLEE